jgi:hypothetical protein
MGLRDFVEMQMQEDESSGEFALWAFGEDYKNYIMKGFLNAWNERHELQLKTDGTIYEDVNDMVASWRKSKKLNI